MLEISYLGHRDVDWAILEGTDCECVVLQAIESPTFQNLERHRVTIATQMAIPVNVSDIMFCIRSL
jgi:hypothetical protein